MKITADTNVLVRAIVADDVKQARIAQSTLARADLVVITSTTLCEFVWVLARGYGVAAGDIAKAIRGLLASANVEAPRAAVAAGLSLLDEGGDFADGVIAFEGAFMGADTFASFDREAVELLDKHGQRVLLLS